MERPAETSVLGDPISRIEWREVTALRANLWNPNVQFKREHRLLEQSILTTGWVQPILITKDGTILDGYHRWCLARDSQAIREKYHGLVPCAVLDVDEAEARVITVRMNRAKGVHAAVRMADLVQDLVDDHGLTFEQVAERIGATVDEVALLHQDSIFKARKLDELPYSKAWVPREDGRRKWEEKTEETGE